MARLEMSVLEASDSATAGGTPDALFELGLMYCAGREVELDLVSAHKWFNLAAMRGNDDAKRYRMEIAHEMSKAQIAEAQRLAREWLARPAGEGVRPLADAVPETH
jgi:TPR repeat protein